MSHCFYSHVPLLLGRPIVGEGGVKAMVENGIVEEGRPCQIPLLSSSMRTIRKIEIDLAYFRKKENVLLIYIIENSNNFDKILLLLISHSYSAFDISLPTSICGWRGRKMLSASFPVPSFPAFQTEMMANKNSGSWIFFSSQIYDIKLLYLNCQTSKKTYSRIFVFNPEWFKYFTAGWPSIIRLKGK